ncbi:MAG: hypothetical protein ACO3HC_04195 [Flavobacteriaceae bacterium]
MANRCLKGEDKRNLSLLLYYFGLQKLSLNHKANRTKMAIKSSMKYKYSVPIILKNVPNIPIYLYLGEKRLYNKSVP